MGLRIIPSKEGAERSSHDAFIYDFRVLVGSHVKGEPYVTSPSIREFIKEGKLPNGMSVGIISFLVRKKEKSVEFFLYYPLDKAGFLAKGGVATGLELACMRHLQNEYRGYTIRPPTKPLLARKLQLQKRRNMPSEGLDVAIKKSQKYLVDMHKQRRPPKRKPLA